MRFSLWGVSGFAGYRAPLNPGALRRPPRHHFPRPGRESWRCGYAAPPQAVTRVSPYASSEGSYAYISIFFYTATDQMWLVFFGSGIDETAVLPAGTYTPTTTWGIVNGMQASSGYTPGWFSPSSYMRYYYDNGHFGEYAPYFITGGYVNVTHSGSNTVLDLHLTTHKGSHITGTITADLKSSLSSAPARGREMIEQHVRNSRKQ